MRSKTSHVIGTMLPERSAKGMNSAAGTKRPDCVRHRTKASTPQTRRFAISTFGWKYTSSSFSWTARVSSVSNFQSAACCWVASGR